MNMLKLALVSAAILTAATVEGAGAMPPAKLNMTAIPKPAAQAQDVAWVCGPYRCVWRPNYSGYYDYYPGGTVGNRYIPGYGNTGRGSGPGEDW
jgi:hypothetical protein